MTADKLTEAALAEHADLVRHMVADHGMARSDWHRMSPEHLFADHDRRHLRAAVLVAQEPVR